MSLVEDIIAGLNKPQSGDEMTPEKYAALEPAQRLAFEIAKAESEFSPEFREKLGEKAFKAQARKRAEARIYRFEQKLSAQEGKHQATDNGVRKIIKGVMQ